LIIIIAPVVYPVRVRLLRLISPTLIVSPGIVIILVVPSALLIIIIPVIVIIYKSTPSEIIFLLLIQVIPCVSTVSSVRIILADWL